MFVVCYWYVNLCLLCVKPNALAPRVLPHRHSQRFNYLPDPYSRTAHLPTLPCVTNRAATRLGHARTQIVCVTNRVATRLGHARYLIFWFA
jgi:hypothetical protein